MSDELEAFSQLLESLYRAPLDDSPWSEFLEELRQRLSSATATFILCSRATGLPLYSDVAGNVAAHERGLKFLQVNPFQDLPDGTLLEITEVVPEQEYRESEFYRLLLAPLDVHHILGADLHVGHDVYVMLRIVRSEAAGAYTPEERAYCARLLPHLRQAVRLFLRLDRQASLHGAYATTLDMLPVGMLVLNAEGRVLQSNRTAQDILATKNGLMVQDGMLMATQHGNHQRLRALIHSAAEDHQCARSMPMAVSIGRGKQPSLSLIVRSAPRTEDVSAENSSAVLVMISDPTHQPPLSAEVIADLFGFTAAEAGLVVLLANGATLDEAAQALGVTRNTVRTQLYTAFQKAGVNRQAQLVSRVLRSAAAMGRLQG